MGTITVNTDEVNSIANELEALNKQLKSELTTTSEVMKNLGNYWSSTAYSESNTAFQKFEEEYSNKYDQIISSYVTFLREQVSSGYVSAEKANTDLSSAFK